MSVVWIALGCAGADSDTGAGGSRPSVDVVSVRATGDAGVYTLFVALASDETGCEQYADWWEVVEPGGSLRYRRILEHSHPDEQPFERSGGPVDLAADEEVVVRGHLHVDGGGGGYVGAVLRGSIVGGFEAWEPPADFAAALASDPPLPAGCLF
jgi:hypothetical protein